jgi:BolA protein
MSTPEKIRQKLATLMPEHIELIDDSHRHAGHAGAAAGGGHYQLFIVSEKFAGQPTQARHRMVYAALGPLMQREIHALSIKAYTPAEV